MRMPLIRSNVAYPTARVESSSGTPVLNRVRLHTYLEGLIGVVPESRPPVTLEILLPTLNDGRRLPEALRVLSSYLVREPYASAIVVIDCGSLDDTVDVVVQWPQQPIPVHLIGCPSHGREAARRLGVETSRAAVIAALSMDLASSPTAIAHALETAHNTALQSSSATLVGRSQVLARMHV